MTTIETNLLEPFLDEGVRGINFFNGRLLTAEDLRAERDATRRRLRGLGKSLGAGVVDGLWVRLERSGAAPVVRVEPGLAVNHEGDVLELPLAASVALTKQENLPTNGAFGPCQPVLGQTLQGRGVYLLVLEPARGLRETAPRSGLGTDGRVVGCDAAFIVEGVAFRLLQLDPKDVPELDATVSAALAATETTDTVAARSMRRNLLAHLCFGTLARKRRVREPFARDPTVAEPGASDHVSYGALDALRRLGRLRTCDVPLALVSWLGTAVDFIDLWSVRRRIVPRLRSRDRPGLGDLRTMREGEAAFLQLEDHVRWLSTQTALPAIAATDYFRFLPAAGVIPLARSGVGGVVSASFFRGVPIPNQPRYVDARALAPLLEESWQHEAIDLSERELVWVYVPWQTALANEVQGANIPAVLVFAGPNLPALSIARFDLARWGYANFSK